ncbi:hypothetical protein HDU98_011393 [Podochytrium sp. JEL0797]|nr:hypothetical protein HDU98_011393 [Podochytrium sp. JEL0797]
MDDSRSRKGGLELDIDLLQAQFLDYLNGELGLTGESGIFGGSLLNLSKPFDPFAIWKRVHRYAVGIQHVEYDRENIVELARRARANLIAYKILRDQPSLLSLLPPAAMDTTTSSTGVLKQELESVLATLTQSLYGWISPAFSSIHDMQKTFKSAETPKLGLVFSTGKQHFEFAIHGILSLRTILNCTLPIEVQYMGEEDLEADMLTALQSIPGVTTVDILKKFDASGISGWAIKPFAMLAAGFETVIFVDADALFLQNPEVMVKESVILKEFGQLFFTDRTLFQPKYDSVEWFRSMDPVMTRYASTLRYTTHKSHHEMESGVVVVDKSRTDSLHALLLTCRMNSKVEREVVYSHVYGDKETFWMSWDMLRSPFRFATNSGGTIGRMNEATGSVCGPLFHTDEFSRALWWNGGLFECKYLSTELFLQFDYAAFDTHGTGLVWEMYGEMPLCLLPGNRETEVIKLDAGHKAIEKKTNSISMNSVPSSPAPDKKVKKAKKTAAAPETAEEQIKREFSALVAERDALASAHRKEIETAGEQMRRDFAQVLVEKDALALQLARALKKIEKKEAAAGEAAVERSVLKDKIRANKDKLAKAKESKDVLAACQEELQLLRAANDALEKQAKDAAKALEKAQAKIAKMESKLRTTEDFSRANITASMAQLKEQLNASIEETIQQLLNPDSAIDRASSAHIA